MKKILLHVCHLGFGDNMYERPFVVGMAQEFDEVYVETPFPQLYWDQDPGKFKFVPRPSVLHLQNWAIADFEGPWSEAPDPGAVTKHTNFFGHCHYTSFLSFPDWIFQRSGLKDFSFTSPVDPQWYEEAREILYDEGLDELDELCIVKRPTVRKEWPNQSRNPKIEYVQAAVNEMRRRGYTIVSVAHLRDGEEWLDGELSGVDCEMHAGELSIWGLLGLVHRYSLLCICAPSFFIPFCLGTGVSCFCIYGGSASPVWHTSSRIPGPFYAYAAPDPFCDCGRMDHDCNKEIENFDKKFRETMDRWGV